MPLQYVTDTIINIKKNSLVSDDTIDDIFFVARGQTLQRRNAKLFYSWLVRVMRKSGRGGFNN